MKRSIRFGMAMMLTGCLAAGCVMPAAAGTQIAPGAAASVLHKDAASPGKAVSTAAVKTQAASITGYAHVARTETSATVKCDAVEGATTYVFAVKKYDKSGKALSNDFEYHYSRTPEMTISELPKGGLAVVVIGASNEDGQILAEKSFAAVPTLPAVKKVESAWDGNTLRVGAYQNSVADECIMEYRSLKGKKLQTKTVSFYSGIANDSLPNVKRNTPVRLKITPKLPNSLAGEETILGKARTFICVPQPQIVSTKKDVKANSVNIKWKKVKFAKSYTIYACVTKTSPFAVDVSKLKFRKVKTVSAKKKGYKLTKINGKRLNNRKYYCYFKVVTTAKIGNQTVKSSDLNYFYARYGLV